MEEYGCRLSVVKTTVAGPQVAHKGPIYGQIATFRCSLCRLHQNLLIILGV